MAGGFHTWAPAVGCGSGPLPGTTALQTAALRRWAVRGARSQGIFNCRKVAGQLTWSVHSEGRALDLAVGAGGEQLGDEILEELVAQAWPLGLQRIIWQETCWDRDDPDGAFLDTDGAHDDHLHIEQAWIGARGLTEQAAIALIGGGHHAGEREQMDHIVRWGGLWLVAQDLSSKTPLASTADVEALIASGGAKQTHLTAAQMVKIPTVEPDGD